MTSEEEFILGCAVRYCLGRSTYAPHMVMDYMEKHFDELSNTFLEGVSRDIEKQARFGLGMKMDEERWLALDAKIQRRLHDGV